MNGARPAPVCVSRGCLPRPINYNSNSGRPRPREDRLPRLTVATSRVTVGAMMTVKSMPQPKLPPIHPGEILLEEFLKPLGISQYRLAKDISVPTHRINEIVLGRR